MKTKIFISIFISILSLSTISCAQSKTTNQTTNNMDTKVLIKTSMGDIVVKLYNDTELHKKNFINLVKEHYYDGLLFHRVINQFMIQGGDPNSKNAKPNAVLGSGGPGYTIPAEICPKHYHKKGALAAARTGDQMNPTRRSSGSQFYIVTGKVYTDAELNQLEKRMNTVFTPEQRKDYTTIGGVPFLDGQYTVFGEVVSGMDVAEKIQKVPTGANDRPKEDVKIISMEIIK